MKTKLIPLLIISFLLSGNVEAQFLKKLKKKAEAAAERTILRKTDEKVSQTTEDVIDSITKGGDKNTNKNAETELKTVAFSNPSLKVNTEAKKAHYTTDIKVISFDKEKNSAMTSYFDADAVAMKSNWIDERTGEPKTSFTDSEGFFISFNEKEQQYHKSSLLAMGGMSMMAPSIMAEAYKLPTNAIYEAMEDMQSKDLKVYPFMHIDFPFILKPEHFREEDTYIESTQACRGQLGCAKFSVTDPEHKGSYIVFNNKDQLIEINAVVKNDPNFGSGQGKIEYFYEDCEVRLPKAVEKKMPGQFIFERGLDPSKN